MAIRERPSKKTKKGVTYQVYFDYKDRYGRKQTYIKGGFLKKKDAEAHEVIKKSELINTGDIFKESSITLEEAYNLYIKQADLKKSTRQTYESRWKNALYLLGDYRVTVIDNLLCQDAFDKMTTLNWGSKDIVLRLLNNILKYSYENGFLKDKKRIKVYLGERTEKEITPVDEQVLLDYMEYIKESKTSVFKNEYIMALWIGYYTGMRIGEVFALNVSDIDFENNIIHVNKTLEYDGVNNYLYITPTKTKASTSTLPLARQLKEIILDYLADHPYEILISKDGAYIKPGNLAANMVYYSNRHGVHIHFHQLRHAMATRLCEADVNPKIAQKILRHAKIETTLGIYTHIQKDIIDETLNDVFENVKIKTKPVKNLSKTENGQSYNKNILN